MNRMGPEEIIFNVRTNTGNSVNDVDSVTDSLKETNAASKAASKELTAMAERAAALTKSLVGLKEGTPAFDKIQEELKQLNKDMKDAAAGGALLDKKFDEIYDGLTPLTGRIGELEDRLYELAAAGEKDSDVFDQIAKEVVRLKTVLMEVDKQIDAAATKGANLQAAFQLGETVIAGYGALQGVMALAGGAAEEFEETLIKLEAAQALLNSIEQIRLATEKESFLMQKAMVIWTNLQTAASNKLTIAQIAQNGIMGITTAVTSAAATAMGVLNAVMLLNPVFLLIAAFAAIAGAFALFGGSADHAAEDNEALNKSVERANELLEIQNEKMIRAANNRLKQAQAEGASEEALLQKRLEVLKTEENAREKNVAETKRQIAERSKVYRQAILEDDEETAKAAGDELRNLYSKHKKLKALDGQYYADRRAMLTEFHREQLQLEMKDEAATIQAKVIQARGNFAEQQKLRKEQAAIERNQALQDVNLTEGQKFLIQQQYEEKIGNLNKEAADRGKKARDERLQKEKEAAAKRLELDRLITDLSVANIKDEWQRKFTELAVAQQRERDDLIAKYGKNTELLKELEAKQAADLMKLDEEQFKAEQAKLDEQAKEELERQRANNRAWIEGNLIAAMEDFDEQQKIKRELAKMDRDLALEDKKLSEGEKFKIEQEYNQKLKELDDEKTEHEKANAEKLAEVKKQLQEAAFKFTQDLANAGQAVSDAVYGGQLSALKESTDKQLSLVEAGSDAEKEIKEKASMQELAIKKKQFEINKKLQLVNAAIQGTQAVLAAYSSGAAIPVVGAVMGPAFAALAAVTVAANIAKIKSSTFDGGAPAVAAPSSVTPPQIMGNGSEGTNSGTTDLTGLQQAQPSQVVLVVDSYKKVAEQSAKAQEVATVG